MWFPVNVVSAVSRRFGHIYWKNPEWKTSFFVQYRFLYLANLSKLTSAHPEIIRKPTVLEAKFENDLTVKCQIYSFRFPLKPK